MPATAAAGLVASPEAAYDSMRAREQTGFQRWNHLFMQGYPARAEGRRTGFRGHLVLPGCKALSNPQSAVEQTVTLFSFITSPIAG